MNIYTYEDKVRMILREPLNKLGFSEKEPLLFIRESFDVMEILSFGGRLDNSFNQYMFSCTVGIRFFAIEGVLRPDRVNEIIPTIMIPLHLLHEDRVFTEWFLDENESDDFIKEKVMREVETYALPFFKKFSNIDNVKKSLETSKPENWFVLNPEQRICILAIIEKLKGNSDRAIEIIDSALEERKGALPKKRRKLKQIREHLI